MIRFRERTRLSAIAVYPVPDGPIAQRLSRKWEMELHCRMIRY
jgi:hypothetical protein